MYSPPKEHLVFEEVRLSRGKENLSGLETELIIRIFRAYLKSVEEGREAYFDLVDNQIQKFESNTGHLPLCNLLHDTYRYCEELFTNQPPLARMQWQPPRL